MVQDLLELSDVDERDHLEDELAVPRKDDLLAFFAQLLRLQYGVGLEAGADLLD